MCLSFHLFSVGNMVCFLVYSRENMEGSFPVTNVTPADANGIIVEATWIENVARQSSSMEVLLVLFLCLENTTLHFNTHCYIFISSNPPPK